MMSAAAIAAPVGSDVEEREAPVPPRLALAGIEKSFASVRVLKGVSLACRPGQVMAILGENGAGKSTLVKIIAGAIAPDAGTITLDSEAVTFRTPIEAASAGIGVVYQELTLVDSLSIGENLFLGREPTRAGFIDRRALREKSEHSLSVMQLVRGWADPIGNLTVAEKHLLEIARTVSRRFRVLIFDEPTSALGRAESLALFKFIALLKEQGVAILYISHRLDEVLAVCDAVTILKDGVVAFEGPVAGLSEKTIIAHMIGREVTAHEHAVQLAGGDSHVVLDVNRLSGERFDDLSFGVRGGEVTGLTGLLGCGALEVVETLAGTRRAGAGAVRLFGEKLALDDPRAVARRGVRFAPEDRKRDGLPLSRTARENISAGILDDISSRGVIDKASERRLVEEAAAQVLLAPELLDRECRFLSGGQQQKVMLARCLIARPRLLLLAEPTRGVDVGARAEIYGIIARLAEKGMAIVLVSSDTQEVVDLCDRVLVLERGRIAAQLSGPEVTRPAILSAQSKPQAAALERQEGPRLRSRFSGLFGDTAVPIGALLVTGLVFALFAPHFLTVQNFEGLSRQLVPLAIASLGQMLVILVGGIDLSIGAVVSISNMISAYLLLHFHPAVAVAACLGVGLAVGLANATLTYLRFPPFLSTYAMALILTGISFAVFGQSVGPVPESFWAVATAQIGPIPAPVLVVLALFAIAHIMLWRTALGRHLFAFGRDHEAARLNGVRPFRTLAVAYVSSSVAAAMVGIYLSARIGAGLPQSGLGLELEAIAAVVLGGASLFGGKVSAIGTLGGVMVLSLIANGFNLMQIDPFYSGMLRGGVMLLVVGIWAARQGKRNVT